MLNIADAFRFEEQLHKARPYAERALAIRARILGDDHPDTVDAMLVVGWMDWGDGDRATARTLLERGLAACVRVAGEGSKCENDLIGALAQVEADDGNRTRAYELAARAEASSLRAGGPEGQLHMYAQRVHGLLLVDDRRFAEARTILADSIRSLAKATGDDSFEVAQTRYYLARAYAEDGDCTNGTKLFRQLLDFASRSLRPGHPLSAYPLNGLAECQLAQGDARAALATFEQVMAIRDAVESPDEEKAKTQLGLSRALIATGGDRERARALARDAVAGFRAGGPGYQWHIDDAQRWLDGL
jgi:tetratricopeptide (TPR) repeat protein